MQINGISSHPLSNSAFHIADAALRHYRWFRRHFLERWRSSKTEKNWRRFMDADLAVDIVKDLGGEI